MGRTSGHAVTVDHENLSHEAAQPVEEGARELLWLDPRLDDADPRVSKIGRGRGGVEYELCSRGGAYFIRRTHWVSSSKKTIRETPRAIRSQVEVDWEDLFAGRAQ